MNYLEQKNNIFFIYGYVYMIWVVRTDKSLFKNILNCDLLLKSIGN